MVQGLQWTVLLGVQVSIILASNGFQIYTVSLVRLQWYKKECKFCLHKKKDGEKHFLSAVDGCHIGPASIRQKNFHKDSRLKRDNLCYEHKMSYLIDRDCYLSTEGGKKANTFREPRYIRSQEK